MLIGIDASRTTKFQKTGTEYYSQQIIKALSKIDRKNRYILYSPIRPENNFSRHLGKNFHWKIMPFPKLWSQFRLSWELISASKKPDVIFEPAHTIPVVHTKNMVVTIHDLGFRYYPELYSPLERRYHNFSAKFSATHAAHIIAVSEYTKKDLLRHYKVHPDKIIVIHHGYDKNKFKPAVKNEKIAIRKSPFEIRQPYILFIGRLERKKNLQRILETYKILKKDSKFKHQLVLAGKPGFGYEDAIKLKTNGVIETGYINDEIYLNLLKNADVFFFPSLFEGFGMPIAEAMACGVPVVASNTTSIPEIVGDAAILVNPLNTCDMAAAILKIVNSPKLRQQFIKKGFDQVKKFSWEKAARQTLEILQKVGNA